MSNLAGRVDRFSILYTEMFRDFVFLTSHKSEKKCGKIESTDYIEDEEGKMIGKDFGKTPFTRRSYVEEIDAEMDMWIEIFPTHGNYTKLIEIVITPFRKECYNSQKLRDFRPCPGTTKCIRSELFCDGVVNCPEMPKDEETEHCGIELEIVEEYYNVPLVMIVLLVVLFLISLVANFMRDIFVICRYLAGKRPSDDRLSGANTFRIDNERRADNSQHIQSRHDYPSDSDQHTHGIAICERSNQIGVGISPLPLSPPAYSDIIQNSSYDSPPSYQSYL